jgi:hypothetical protein
MHDVARKYNPNFMIAGNVFGGFGYGPIAYDAAGNLEMLGRDGHDDFVYSEIQERLDSAPRKDDSGTKITNSSALKFLAAATHGKPVVIYATEITPPIFPNPTERCLSAMAQINIAEAVANRAVFREKRETPPGATEVYRFLAANEPALRNVRLYSNVGLVVSLRQYLADELSFAFSTSRVLADNGISHLMLTGDDLLTPALNQFDLVIVPYLPLLSAEQQEHLLDYAKSGNTLLVLGASGSKDQYGVRQSQIPLAKVFAGNKYPDNTQTRTVGKGKVIFIPLSIPSSRFLIPMKSQGDYTTFGPTMADLFPDIPEGYTRNRIDPSLRSTLEKVAGTVGNALGTGVTRLTQPAPYVEINSMLETTGKRMLVHVVNYNVTVEGAVTPARNLQLQVALPPGKTVGKVNWSGTLSEMRPLSPKVSLHRGRQSLVVNLDEVRVYGLLNIELD